MALLDVILLYLAPSMFVLAWSLWRVTHSN